MIQPWRVTNVLLDVVSRRYPVTRVGETWDDVYAGDFTFTTNGWTIVVFNDCDSVDYVDSCTSPSGETCGFDDWYANERLNPLFALSPGQIGTLMTILKEA